MVYTPVNSFMDVLKSVILINCGAGYLVTYVNKDGVRLWNQHRSFPSDPIHTTISVGDISPGLLKDLINFVGEDEFLSLIETLHRQPAMSGTTKLDTYLIMSVCMDMKSNPSYRVSMLPRWGLIQNTIRRAEAVRNVNLDVE